MKKMPIFLFVMALSIMALTAISPAEAALQAVGPTSPVTTMPAWYQDTGGVALTQCLDQNGFCVLAPPFNVNPPAITTVGPINDLNFPVEGFYFLADSTMGVGAKAVLRLALEGASAAKLAPLVVPGQMITFVRINLKKMAGLTPNSTYTVTHPYGTFTFTSDALGNTPPAAGQAFRAQDGCAVAPCDFTLLLPATTTALGPFLSGTAGSVKDPVTGNTYLGNPLAPTTVTGSPLSTNFFRIDGPNIGGTGVNTISTDQFNLSGKKYGMQFTPVANDYGGVVVASPTPAPVQTFTVTNVNTFNVPAGAGDITIGSVAAIGPNTADFVINPAGTDTCIAGKLLTASTPAAPTTCTVSVAFVPKPLTPAPEVAIRTATLQIIPSTVGAPTGQAALSGTAQYTMNADFGANGTISPAGTGIIVNAGATQAFTVTPNAKFQVKDITVDGALAHFIAPANPGAAVTFTAPAATTNGTTVNATFMPSGDLTADGKLSVDDAVKALRIFVGLQIPVGDDLTAMKVAPLDATGRPNGTGAPDLNDVVLILKRVLGIIKW